MKTKYKCPSCAEMWYTEEDAQRCCIEKNAPLLVADYFAKKADKGKLQHSLIDPEFIEGMAEVLTYGINKYKKKDSWKTVDNAKDRYLDALIRHEMEYRKGNKFDNESEIHHLLHLAVNAMFLYYFSCVENKKWLDRVLDDEK